jgi:hypothetical protein
MFFDIFGLQIKRTNHRSNSKRFFWCYLFYNVKSRHSIPLSINSLYNFSDPINVSLEIGRRGFELIILKKRNKEGVSGFYPEFDLNMIRDELRKQTAGLELNNWKELHTFLKNSKVRYRVSLDEASTLHKVFCRKFYSKKSKVIINYIKCNSFIL